MPIINDGRPVFSALQSTRKRFKSDQTHEARDVKDKNAQLPSEKISLGLRAPNVGLQDLSENLIQKIMTYLNPHDIAALSISSKMLGEEVIRANAYGDGYFYHNVSRQYGLQEGLRSLRNYHHRLTQLRTAALATEDTPIAASGVDDKAPHWILQKYLRVDQKEAFVHAVIASSANKINPGEAFAYTGGWSGHIAHQQQDSLIDAMEVIPDHVQRLIAAKSIYYGLSGMARDSRSRVVRILADTLNHQPANVELGEEVGECVDNFECLHESDILRLLNHVYRHDPSSSVDSPSAIDGFFHSIYSNVSQGYYDDHTWFQRLSEDKREVLFTKALSLKTVAGVIGFANVFAENFMSLGVRRSLEMQGFSYSPRQLFFHKIQNIELDLDVRNSITCTLAKNLQAVLDTSNGYSLRSKLVSFATNHNKPISETEKCDIYIECDEPPYGGPVSGLEALLDARDRFTIEQVQQLEDRVKQIVKAAQEDDYRS